MGRTEMIMDEAALLRRATRTVSSPLEQARWRDRYHDAIRPRRINALLRFVRYASIRARQEETHGGGWYGDHVVWAISRLVALGYTFPECEPIYIRALPRFEDRRRAA